MGALKLPQVLAYNARNKHLCHRIGVRLNGKDMEAGVIAYNVAEGYVILQKTGDRKNGVVEPYWRS